MVMRFVSLFAGIGGIDLGLERAGMECVAQVEIDEWCRSILNKHWPEVQKYEDVFDLSGSDLPSCELIAGGFPCQPVSKTGRRQGTSDHRWLWPEFSRLVDEVRPKYVLVENVPEVRVYGGAEIGADLAAMGYDAQWGELPAATVGAPHLRQRFILVAYRDGKRRQQESRSPLGNEGASAWRAAVHDHLAGSSVAFDRGPEWPAEPEVDRMANGIPPGLVRDQLRGLGNAVVPAVAEWVGTRLIEFDRLS